MISQVIIFDLPISRALLQSPVEAGESAQRLNAQTAFLLDEWITSIRNHGVCVKRGLRPGSRRSTEDGRDGVVCIGPECFAPSLHQVRIQSQVIGSLRPTSDQTSPSNIGNYSDHSVSSGDYALQRVSMTGNSTKGSISCRCFPAYQQSLDTCVEPRRGVDGV